MPMEFRRVGRSRRGRLFMTNETLNKLKQGHIDLLKARKLRDGLCEVRNKVINGKGLNRTPKPKRAKRHRQ